ncbi:DNA-MISMATCH-REPAIR-2 domain-containing protein [Aphelenchoides besseyi]|nr:DNA-MISMATCH-REPAIR-2 domain-containing protein [Aphelenchoides besseyi]KAI6194142.1 DNA-MISMATCH-REPAIR-2 domain-containing protein [Aphelenchoides besseyi]
MDEENENSTVRMDNAAIAALELFNSNVSKAANRDYTIYGVINKCKTTKGRELLGQWLKNPLNNVELLNQRLDVVEAFNEAPDCRDMLNAQLLPQVTDISATASKLEKKNVSLEHCYRLYRAVRTLKTINEILPDVNASPAVQKLISIPLQRSANELAKFADLIEETVEFIRATGEYRVKPVMSETLLQLNQEMDELKEKANRELSRFKAEINEESVKLEENLNIGFFFRVTCKVQSSIRKANVDVVETNKAGVKFHTTALAKLNPTLLDLREQYESTQEEIRRAIERASAGYIPSFEALDERIGVLDVLVGFSVLTATAITPYVRPELHEPGTRVFELIECRHPVLENSPLVKSYIPNDIKFDTENFICLTGANMGGKSSYLRSAAITVLLGQIGCFVPCQSARFSLVDGIFTRVGAQDYIYKGVSTFMAEMNDCASILKNATPNSLVIIDELGRGTSTFDGFGIAISIAEEIVTRGCYSMFATHFHEMGILKERYPDRVQNLKVDTYADENGAVTILYKISPGVAEKSFGICIARMVGFPDSVIKDAEETLELLESTESSSRDARALQILNKCRHLNPEEIRQLLVNFTPEQLDVESN